MNGIFEKRKIKQLNQVQYIAFGFLLMILVGTFLLLLPISTVSGEQTTPLNALFTATSASCVTGLVMYDTATHWTLFGQLVIMLMIQIGGLGFITIGVGFSMMFRRRIGLRQRDLMKESVNANAVGGILRLWKEIIIGTVIFEGAGAILLSIRFVPEFGFAKGIFYGIFHSISAFCNGGFDLMGVKEKYSSFCSYVDDPLVILTLCALIVIGSLGFVVWTDLKDNHFRWSKVNLHTKLVLATNAFLLVGGTLLMYLIERDNTLLHLSANGRFLGALFGAVTPRTAGMNTVDTGLLTPAGKFLTILLMFIGGSPGSTAGGVKTTTVAVIVIYIFSNLRGNSGCNVFHRRIGDEVIKKAAMVFGLNLILALLAILVILSTSGAGFDDTMFEVISAISTVGMSTGITRDLNVVGRIVVILLMYCGRIGSMTFALSLIQKPVGQATMYPQERVTIG